MYIVLGFLQQHKQFFLHGHQILQFLPASLALSQLQSVTSKKMPLSIILKWDVIPVGNNKQHVGTSLHLNMELMTTYQNDSLQTFFFLKKKTNRKFPKNFRQKNIFSPPHKKLTTTTTKSPDGASNDLLLFCCWKKSFCPQLLSGSFSSPALGLSWSPPADSRLFKQSADIPESRLGQWGGCREEGRTCFLTSQPVTVIPATHTQGGKNAFLDFHHQTNISCAPGPRLRPFPVECISNYHTRPMIELILKRYFKVRKVYCFVCVLLRDLKKKKWIRRWVWQKTAGRSAWTFDETWIFKPKTYIYTKPDHYLSHPLIRHLCFLQSHCAVLDIAARGPSER